MQICPLKNSLSTPNHASKSCHKFTAVAFKQNYFLVVVPRNCSRFSSWVNALRTRVDLANHVTPFGIDSCLISRQVLSRLMWGASCLCLQGRRRPLGTDTFALIASSVTSKKSPNVYKSCPKMIPLENERFRHVYKNCLKMWAIWA